MSRDPEVDQDVAELARLIRAKRQHRLELLSKPNVIGLDVGNKTRRGQPTGQKAIKVYVTRKLPLSALAAEDVIPSAIEIDGESVPTDVEVKAMDRPHGGAPDVRPIEEH